MPERNERTELGEEDVAREDRCPECGGPRDDPGLVVTGPLDGFGGPLADPCENEYHDGDS